MHRKEKIRFMHSQFLKTKACISDTHPTAGTTTKNQITAIPLTDIHANSQNTRK